MHHDSMVFGNLMKINGNHINVFDSKNFRKKNKEEILVFVPGEGGCIKNWKYQFSYFFEKGYRVISFDPIGQGNSQFVTKYSFKDHYRDFLMIINKLGIKKIWY
ncbi:MAG: alpha/beta fold hydrolase [Candidatus Woesearchaeota archaeon]